MSEHTVLTSSAANPVRIGADRLRLAELVAFARGRRALTLSGDAAFRARIEKGHAAFNALLAKGVTIYGVTTGYGDCCEVAVPAELVAELPRNLTRYHGCGLGEELEDEAVRAVLAARLNSLARGYSGVRWQLLEQLAAFAQNDILPCIPCEGSVGASGDLTPLSYVAAALIGEREVRFRGERLPASEALAMLGRAPLQLAPKEGLAIMNGTAVMTGLAALAWDRAEYLSRLASRITALASAALNGHRGHFDPLLFAAKPHVGQGEIAAFIHGDLAAQGEEALRLQDRYSLRCAPHVIGVLRDALGWLERDIENELNSANDNPLIDPESGRLLHGGHFYGGHIGFAMDALKTAVASIADLMDRQLALLVDPRYSNGLPLNLSGATRERAMINHGFKAVQIAVSAWTAEALKLTLPATSFSRSTECHNQDKVSMGTIAARDCLRVLELAEQVAAALLLSCRQALALRQRQDAAASARLAPRAQDFLATLAADFELVCEDRPLERDLRATVATLRQQVWSLYR
jgi:histidine ammonia-lyase